MSMILPWEELVQQYGDINSHKKSLNTPGQQTYALLLCRIVPDGTLQVEKRTNRVGGHAEQWLVLDTPLWKKNIPTTLRQKPSSNRHHLHVTLVINRTPCNVCADLLSFHLRKLKNAYPWPFRNGYSRFTLACRGSYEGAFLDKVRDRVRPDRATTVGGLSKLQAAGWDVRVLDFGNSFRPDTRAQEFLDTLNFMRA